MAYRKLTPAQAEELRRILTGIERGNYDRYSMQRARELMTMEVTAQVQQEMAQQLPRIEARARLLREARQAGQAAARRVGQRFMSEAHRRTHDSITRNRR